jgi:hypothetical protein
LSSPPESPQRKFFDELAAAGDAYDLFSVNLYGDPARVPDFVAQARATMAPYGEPKEIVAGEHGGPVVFELPAVEAVDAFGDRVEAFVDGGEVRVPVDGTPVFVS